jgi:DNA-binding response OmpR family regulator
MLGGAIIQGLSDQGMSVDWVQNGEDGYAALQRAEHAIALLDVGLPGMSGLEVLKSVRTRGGAMPILVITARAAVEDVVNGLDLGADDYLTKPFELRALLARMRAILRRFAGRTEFLLTSAEITLDPSSRIATFRGQQHVLSAREFALLNALMEKPGKILSRSQVEDRIYGWGDEVQSNAVEFLIHGLRRKYGKDIIRNVRGAGWMVTKDLP